MKWLCTALAAILLTAVFGLPFEEYDTAKLLPIETLQVAAGGQGVLLLSEAGSGEGKDFTAAVESLRQNASGDVFFDTAEHIVLCDARLLPQLLESELLRPAANVYFAESFQDPAGLSSYLAAHKSDLTLAHLRAAEEKGKP